MIWGGHAMEDDEEEEEEAEENGEEEKQEEEKPKPKEPTTSQRKTSVVPAANQARKTSSATAQQPKTALSSLSSTMNSTTRSSSLTGGPQTVVAKRRFEGKVAIVTESNCGIDRATAIMLGKEGAKVTVHGTDEGELRRTVIQMIRADVDQHDILVVQGVIENDDTLKNLVERTIKKFGRIDILVNNAGAITNNQQNNNNSHSRHPHNGGGGEDDEEDEDSSSGGNPLRHRRKSTYHKNSMFFDDDGPSHNFDLLFNINLKSITKLTRFCVPYLEDTKGAVVNVSSFGSQQAFSDYAYYSTAKTALDNYCRSVAIKYATRNIRVNNVNPGFITSEHGDDTETHVNKFYLNWIKNHVPMGRGGTAEEIAKVIVFLASDDASYVTGATIVADGAVSIYSKPADFF